MITKVYLDVKLFSYIFIVLPRIHFPNKIYFSQLYVLPEGYLLSEEANSISEGHREEEAENGHEYAVSEEPSQLSCPPIVDESLD